MNTQAAQRSKPAKHLRPMLRKLGNRRSIPIAGMFVTASCMLGSSRAHASDDWFGQGALPFSFRSGIGATFPINQLTPVSAATETMIGGRLLFGQSGAFAFRFHPELGFAGTLAPNDFRGFLHVTTGIGLGNTIFGIDYHPGLLVGSVHKEPAVGMRNGIRLGFLASALNIELGHAMYTTPTAGLEHEVYFMFTADIVPMVVVFFGLLRWAR